VLEDQADTVGLGFAFVRGYCTTRDDAGGPRASSICCPELGSCRSSGSLCTGLRFRYQSSFPSVSEPVPPQLLERRDGAACTRAARRPARAPDSVPAPENVRAPVESIAHGG
jgi:hypothetical protein